MVEPPEVERGREVEGFVRKGVFCHPLASGIDPNEDANDAGDGDSSGNGGGSSAPLPLVEVPNCEQRRVFEAKLRRAIEIALSKYTVVRDDGTLFSKKQVGVREKTTTATIIIIRK